MPFTQNKTRNATCEVIEIRLCRVLRDRYQLRPRLRRVRYDIV